jgi:hypothetical protein
MCHDFGIATMNYPLSLRQVLGCVCVDITHGQQDETLRVEKKVACVVTALSHTLDGSVCVTLVDPTGKGTIFLDTHTHTHTHTHIFTRRSLTPTYTHTHTHLSHTHTHTHSAGVLAHGRD